MYKKTLNPIFEDEPFAFEVPRALCSLEGAMLHFGVFDHDFVGSNDLEGECVLPLRELHGLHPGDDVRSVTSRPVKSRNEIRTV